MNLRRIKGILMHEMFVTRHSYEVINDIVIYPLWSIIVFGFLTIYLSGVAGAIVAHYILIGMILWQVINITQYSIAVGCLWDVWARNLTNIFITPISIAEYLVSYAISGAIKALIVIILGSILSFFVFRFNILQLGLINLLLYFINLLLFAFTFGIIILSLLFRFGTRIQAFAWGLITFFQPLMAVIYPVSILPEPLKTLAYVFPPTYIFEAARISINTAQIQWSAVLIAIILNAIWFLLAVTFFNYMFRKSREIGQFAKLEG